MNKNLSFSCNTKLLTYVNAFNNYIDEINSEETSPFSRLPIYELSSLHHVCPYFENLKKRLLKTQYIKMIILDQTIFQSIVRLPTVFP